jgi:hypothetical protein
MHKQNVTLLKSLPAMAVLLLSCAYADVIVSETPTKESETPFETEFGQGKISIETASGAPDESIRTTVNGSTKPAGMMQTFSGNGEILEAFAFTSPGMNPPQSGEFVISLLDFGITGPIETLEQLNGPNKVVFSDKFMQSTTDAGQYYFDFEGASAVKLERDHFYGIYLQFENVANTGNIHCFRTGKDVYPGGVGATGTPGLFEPLKIGSETRDLIFGIYTRPSAGKR